MSSTTGRTALLSFTSEIGLTLRCRPEKRSCGRCLGHNRFSTVLRGFLTLRSSKLVETATPPPLSAPGDPFESPGDPRNSTTMPVLPNPICSWRRLQLTPEIFGAQELPSQVYLTSHPREGREKGGMKGDFGCKDSWHTA
jgi:hypothetical protein